MTSNERQGILAPDTFEKYKEEVKRYQQLDENNNMASDITLNSDEEKLDNYMDDLRLQIIHDRYVNVVLGDDKELDKPNYYPPIHPFYEAKKRLQDQTASIEEQKLFDIFKKMPKAGNLHIHTSATLSVEKLMYLLEKFDNGEYQAGSIYVDIVGDKNVPKNTLYCIKNEKLVDSNPRYKRFKKMTNEEKRDLMSDLCFMDDEKVKKIDYIWDEFNDAFSRVTNILNVKEFYYRYYVEAFKESIKDNTDYMELRCGIPTLYENNDNLFSGNTTCIANEYPFTVIYNAYKEAKGDSDFELKIIVSGSRKKETDVIEGQLKDVQKWIQLEQSSKEFKDNPFIIGYDLVGEEDRGHKTDDYAEVFYKTGSVGKIPFYFHDGESCWANDNNIYSAFSLGTKRIGHGLNLFRFPSMVDEMRKENVCLEVCPISNQLLRYTTDLRMHLIGEYINRGNPCVICSDDPQILGNVGLSYDFWEIYLGQIFNLKEIKKLILNSYDYSGMTKEQKEIKKTAWQNKWNQFVKETIANI